MKFNFHFSLLGVSERIFISELSQEIQFSILVLDGQRSPKEKKEVSMTTAKMTHKEMFAYIMEKLADDQMVVEFCQGRLAQLEKGRKATGTKPETVEYRQRVLDLMETLEAPYTAKEITDMLGEGATVGRTASALAHFYKEGQLVRKEGRRVKDPFLYYMPGVEFEQEEEDE